MTGMAEKGFVNIQNLLPVEIGPIWRISLEDVIIQEDWTNLFGKLFIDNY